MEADKSEDLQGRSKGAAGDPGELMVWFQSETQEKLMFLLESKGRKKPMSKFEGSQAREILSY